MIKFRPVLELILPSSDESALFFIACIRVDNPADPLEDSILFLRRPLRELAFEVSSDFLIGLDCLPDELITE